MRSLATSTICLAIHTLPENFDPSHIDSVEEKIEQELCEAGVYAIVRGGRFVIQITVGTDDLLDVTHFLKELELI